MDYTLRSIRGIFLLSLFTTCGWELGSADAQQVQHYGIWRESSELLNPALAGNRENTFLMMNYRSQWLGLDGNPNTVSVLANTYLPAFKGGIGLYFFNDQLGNRNFNQYGLQISRELVRNSKMKWSFGLDLSYENFSLNSEDILLPGGADPGEDTSLTPWFNSRSVFHLGAGTVFSTEQLVLGISGRQLSKFSEKNSNSYITENEWFLNFAYSFSLNNSVELSPFSIFYSNFSVFQSFMALEAVVNEQLYMALGARLDVDELESIGIMLGYEFDNSFGIKYQYEFGLNPLANQSNGSHEILLYYEIDHMFGRSVPRPPIYSPRAL